MNSNYPVAKYSKHACNKTLRNCICAWLHEKISDLLQAQLLRESLTGWVKHILLRSQDLWVEITVDLSLKTDLCGCVWKLKGDSKRGQKIIQFLLLSAVHIYQHVSDLSVWIRFSLSRSIINPWISLQDEIIWSQLIFFSFFRVAATFC